MSSRSATLIKNTALYFAASFASKLLNIILVPIYVAYLNTSEFGEVNLLLLLSGLIGILYTSDIVDAAYRSLLDEKSDKAKIITNALVVYLIGSAVFAVIYIALLYQRLNFTYWLLLFHILLTTLSTIISQFTRGLKCNKVFAGIGIVSSFVQGITNILFIVLWNIGGASLLLAPIVSSICVIFYSIKLTPIANYIQFDSFDFSEIKRMIKYGFPLTIGILLNWCVLNSGTYILAWVTDSTSQSGIFSLAVKISSLIYVLVSIFNMAWQETSVEQYEKGGDYLDYYNNIFNRYINSILYIVCIISIASFVYFAYTNTNDYAAAKYLVPVLLIGNCFYSLQSFLLTGFYVKQQTKSVGYISLICGTFTVLLGSILIPQFELYGLSITVVLGQFSLFLLTYKVVRRYIPYTAKFDANSFWSVAISVFVLTLYYLGNTVYFICGSTIAIILMLYRHKSLLMIIKNKINAKR
jgi:O-antigen/teichoic acid export membrane protein